MIFNSVRNIIQLNSIFIIIIKILFVQKNYNAFYKEQYVYEITSKVTCITSELSFYIAIICTERSHCFR